MKSTKYYCDYCEKELTEDEIIITIGSESENEFKFINKEKNMLRQRFIDLHFCNEIHFTKYFTTIVYQLTN